ncbi:nucleic acid/nucleotide deaminase domain-containing protein [Flavobacterium ginsenosidimutans]|uniref:Nucleic acid/nucleotide deaminase domain-containing protein n=1 Tax=Flavobacterium ginsenosidimutans TaxID=687844 RepID=A0ABZ2Q0R4_9FLAO|nr:nucleic acid/nucleotide deaminase domain-containing protein [Flavobacterium ginsenosidimutans]KAF2338997.1 hypothetical protein DM444_00490 [Flavobacterium ginsenosidimutans]
MKNILKRFLFCLILLVQFISYAQGEDNICPVLALANDLSTANAEFKTSIKDPEIFNAWNLLSKESPALRTNIEELKLVSKNLTEINKAGGYLKWKNTFRNVIKLPLDTGDLGKMAMSYRKSNNFWHDGNIAVFEYLDLNGNTKTLVQTTIPNNGRHAERLALETLEAQNIPPKNIKRIYSELEVCELESGGVGQGCTKMLLDKIGRDLEIIYSYPYPGKGSDLDAKAIRQASLNQRAIDFNNFK